MNYLHIIYTYLQTETIISDMYFCISFFLLFNIYLTNRPVLYSEKEIKFSKVFSFSFTVCV